MLPGLSPVLHLTFQLLPALAEAYASAPISIHASCFSCSLSSACRGCRHFCDPREIDSVFLPHTAIAVSVWVVGLVFFFFWFEFCWHAYICWREGKSIVSSFFLRATFDVLGQLGGVLLHGVVDEYNADEAVSILIDLHVGSGCV